MNVFLLCLVVTAWSAAADYTQNGANWDTGACADGTSQSPIDFPTFYSFENGDDLVLDVFSLPDVTGILDVENRKVQLNAGEGITKSVDIDGQDHRWRLL